MRDWLASALIVAGVLFFGHGILHWSEPPIRDAKWYFGTSQQLVDVVSGIVLAGAGIFRMKTGRWPR